MGGQGEAPDPSWMVIREDCRALGSGGCLAEMFSMSGSESDDEVECQWQSGASTKPCKYNQSVEERKEPWERSELVKAGSVMEGF